MRAALLRGVSQQMKENPSPPSFTDTAVFYSMTVVSLTHCQSPLPPFLSPLGHPHWRYGGNQQPLSSDNALPQTNACIVHANAVTSSDVRGPQILCAETHRLCGALQVLLQVTPTMME